MTLLDEALEDLQSIADGRKAETVFYRQRNGFTTAQRDELAAGVLEIRSLMRGLRNALDVQPNDRDARDRVWSQCEVICDYLEEVSGHQLLRYGAPDPQKADLVTARMREIQARLQSLSDLAWSSRGVGSPGGVVDPEEGEAADPYGSI
jgi:hypothetical protein